MSKPVFTPSALTAVTFKAATCGTVNQFIVLGLLDNRHTIQWCAVGDPTDWPTPGTDDARSKQAGSQTFPTEFGEVTGIAGNDFYGYVFMERGIAKMTYVGGDTVFSFDIFEEGRGCFQLNRLEQVDDLTFFESEWGYHALQNDEIVDIGHGIVDDTYPPQSSTSQQNVCINEAIQCVFFESQNLCYNYKTLQWSRLPVIDGYSLVSINSTDGVIGRAVILTTNGGMTSGTGGTVQTATLTTAAPNINQGGRGVVNGIRPIANGGTYAVRVGTLDDIDGTVAWSASTSVNTRSNMANFRAEGRYHRAEITVTGGFTTYMGAEVDFTPHGRV